MLKRKFFFFFYLHYWGFWDLCWACSLGHGKHPIFPEEEDVPFMTFWPLSWGTTPLDFFRVWFLWPLSSLYHFPVARSCSQSHFVGVDPASFSRLLYDRGEVGQELGEVGSCVWGSLLSCGVSHNGYRPFRLESYFAVFCFQFFYY